MQVDLLHPHQRLREAMEHFVIEAVKDSQAIGALIAAADWSAMFPDVPEPEPIVVDSSLWTGRGS